MPPKRLASADGRTVRRLANRQRILDALFDLVRRGQMHPTLGAVAGKAGVTTRTLLNHFPDTASLLRAAIQRGPKLAARDMPPLPARGDLAPRVHAFFASAGTFYDDFAAIRWSALTFPGKIPGFDIRQQKSPVLARLEQHVFELLGKQGAALRRDRELYSALRVLIDPLTWRMLRLQQGLSKKEAAAVTARGVLMLLAE